MTKQWLIWQDTEQQAQALQADLKISLALCKLLVKRGITNYQAAETFFRPKLEQLHNPFLMKDMQIAVDTILQTIAEKKRILIYGDYDVDGTTAVALVVDFFKAFYTEIDFYIPHRFKEGYGLSEAGINFAIENNFSLIITVDCGIKSKDLVDKAVANKIDVIICDHHLPDEDNLPKAIAILNPKQKACNYPYKELCGCGIGFKLISALEQTMFDEQNLCYNNIDLLATAIAADIVPITDENRVLAYYGLQKANTNPGVAVKSLRQFSKLDKDFTISDLVFILAPRINAAGRMDEAKTAVDLFLSATIEEADKLTLLLNENNTDRKDTDKQTTAEALELLALENPDNSCTILYKSDWHKGVVGIVASRLIENKYQPTLVLTDSDDKISGSARSIPGLNLFEALTACSEYLTAYGGHYYAAGLTLPKENLLAFKEAFNAYVQSVLQPEDYIPKLHIDTELDFQEINLKYYNVVTQMEPYGPENLRPVFVTHLVSNVNSKIVKDKHIRFAVKQNGVLMNGIGFNMAEKLALLIEGQFSIAYTLHLNEFRGEQKLELQVQDIIASK